MHRSFLLAIPLTLISVSVFAADKNWDANWPHWRGPSANGTAPKSDPPIEWSTSKNIGWIADLPGEGASTPIVWNDRVFVLAAEETDKRPPTPTTKDPDARTSPPEHIYRFLVLCFSRETGKLLWQRTAIEAAPHEGRHSTNTYAGGSPVTDGERLYVSFGSRGLFCYDLDGTLQWSRDFGDMRTRRGWGEASTPAVHDNLVILPWDHEDESKLFVLDAKTGQTKWQVDRPEEPSGWSTPLVVERKEQPTQLVVNGTGRARGYELASGKVIWSCGGQTVNAIPTPILFKDHVICMSGYRGNLAVSIPLTATGDLTDTQGKTWEYGQNTPYVPSPVVSDNRLFFTKGNSGILTCLDARTGTPIIAARRLDAVRNIYASPVVASGRLYIVGRDGTTLVLRDSDKAEQLAVNRLDDPIDASPALVGNELFLRSRTRLYCIRESK